MFDSDQAFFVRTLYSMAFGAEPSDEVVRLVVGAIEAADRTPGMPPAFVDRDAVRWIASQPATAESRSMSILLFRAAVRVAYIAESGFISTDRAVAEGVRFLHASMPDRKA